MTLDAEHVDNGSTVHHFCVLLDFELSMERHITKLSSSYILYLCHIRQPHHQVGHDILTHLLLAPVTSRLDYCNSILASLPYL